MTERQAEEIVTLIRAATRGTAEQEKIDYFVARLLPLDYPEALEAATMGTVVWQFFPSWAEFKEIYRGRERAREADRPPVRPPLPPKGKGYPFWVKRWVAARFLYIRFGRDQDWRWFPEQKDWLSPAQLENGEMPAGEWDREAEHVTDKDVWQTLQVTAPPREYLGNLVEDLA